MTAGGHLTSEEVAAYLDNTLSEAERARVKSHIADCNACRQEVVAVSKLLGGASRSRRRFAALSTLAAAAVLAVFLIRSPIDSKSPAGGILRGRNTTSASEGVSGLKAIAPVGRQTSAERIVFVWHPAVTGATYRFTLADDRGGKIWVTSTNDTTLSIPRETPLLKDRDYHWYVDVLLPDGRSAATGITSFQVAR